jgi:hypothetical protein
MSRSPTIDDDRRPSITLIPCEFCHVQHPSDNLIHHQVYRFYSKKMFELIKVGIFCSVNPT